MASLAKILGFRSRKRGRRTIVYPVMARSILKPSVNVAGSPSGTSTLPLKGLHRARSIHERRSRQAQAVDEAIEARITNDVERWSKAPNRWDIRGVDSFPMPTIEGDFVSNGKIFAYQLEQQWNRDLTDIHYLGHASDESFRSASGDLERARAFYAFALPPKSEVHFSPQATELIAKGRVDDKSEFFAMDSVAHEIGHLIGATPTNSAFDEGSNELLACRFTLNNMIMPRRLRREMRARPNHSYEPEVEMVAHTALLVNEGDPEKAVRWLEKFKTASDALTPEQGKKKEEIEREIKRVWAWQGKAMELNIDKKEKTGLDGEMDAELYRPRKVRFPGGEEYEVKFTHPYDIAKKRVDKLRAEVPKTPSATMIEKAHARLDELKVNLDDNPFYQTATTYPSGSESSILKSTEALRSALAQAHPDAAKMAGQSPRWWINY